MTTILSIFMWLLAIHLSFFVKCLFKSLPIFIELFVFLLLSYRNDVYIPDTSSLLDRCFANISPDLWLSWFFLNSVFDEQKFLVFMKSDLTTYYFMVIVFLNPI